jgi:gamma-glutamylcyclotransferase (GGCT)/AIG2-like uncharacterized protein YtfP
MEREHALTTTKSLGPALLRAQLFNLGAYPGTRKGKGIVVGEVRAVTPEMLSLLDDIEGHREGDPENSLFFRQKIAVTLFADGRTVQAWCYYAQKEGEEIIRHGDYRRWRLEKKGGPFLLLSYGSNLSAGRLEERIGALGKREPGSIIGFRLVFNKASKDGSAKANLQWSSESASCPAVADILTSEKIARLDTFEGTPYHYLRIVIQFKSTPHSSPRLAQTYIASPGKLNDSLAVSKNYLDLIRNGYQELGFTFPEC